MVIVDSDLFIAALRHNEMAETLLRRYAKEIAISAVTVMELYVGATNTAKKKMVEEILREHEVVFLTKPISETAIRFLKEYNAKGIRLLMPDALIAATCIEHNAKLLTFNAKDFKFIKGLKLAK